MTNPGELELSPVGLGCWPMAGVSTLNTNDEDSLATIHRAIDLGVTHLDTAYSYGYAGESDRLLAQVLQTRRQEVTLASKVGQYFDAERNRRIDGRPATLISHAQEAVTRLGVEYVDLMYLHVPDPEVPIAESAGAIQGIIDQGLARFAAVSNVNAEQLRSFHRECPVHAVQPPFNMVQQEAAEEIRGFCETENIKLICYWVLMKGLLAGHFSREHQFDPQDKRLSYPIYQGEAWERAQDLLDHLRELAQELDCTVGQLVVAWTLKQPNIDVALCGAKRPDQIAEMAGAMEVKLDTSHLQTIDGWLDAVEL